MMKLAVFVSITTVLLLLLSQQTGAARRRGVSSRSWPVMVGDEHEYELVTPKSNVEWKCTFERHTCGITNDAHVGSFFQLRNTSFEKELFSKRNTFYLNVSALDNSAGARLITPYFQTKHHLFGCLSFEYYIEGDGIENIRIYQQDKENLCLWHSQTRVDAPEKDKWQTLSLTIDLKNGDPRFFIEAHVNHRSPYNGVLAFSEVSFAYGTCDVSRVNYCGIIRDTDYPNDLP